LSELKIVCCTPSIRDTRLETMLVRIRGFPGTGSVKGSGISATGRDGVRGPPRYSSDRGRRRPTAPNETNPELSDAVQESPGGVSLGVIVDPGQAAHVETPAGTRDSHVREAGFTVVDGARQSTARVVLLVAVWGRGEVVGDLHACPFAAFGPVGGRDGHLDLAFGGELGDGGQNGVGAVGVDNVDQRLQVAPCRIVAA
jgi:hypothetical protein